MCIGISLYFCPSVEIAGITVCTSLSSTIFAFSVAEFLISSMPHTHSVEAIFRRRQRAERRGYFCSAPSGFRHVLVEAPLRQQAKVMAQSLAQHAEDERLTGIASHYARDVAARAVRFGHGDDRSLGLALQLHRSANRAKHRPNSSSSGVLLSALKQPAA
jgi:hypothetical protein